MITNPFKDSNKDSLLVLVTVVSSILPFLFAHLFAGMEVVSIVLTSIFMIILANVHLNTSLHYHIHRPIFNSDSINKVFSRLSTIPILIGYEEFKHIHTEHHKYSNDAYENGMIGDPVSTYRYGKDGNEEGFFSYIFKSSFRNYYNSKELLPRRVRIDYNEWKVQNWIKVLTILSIVLINWKFAILYVMLMYLSWTLNAALSYCEHYNAADRSDSARDSTSCYNKWYNLFFFNSGYHQEHHYRPGTHWTKLPLVKNSLPNDRNVIKYTLFHNNPLRKFHA